MSVKFGCAKVDITPDYPVYLCGYAARNCLSKGVEEPLQAGVFVVSGNRRRQIHVTLDNTGFASDNSARLRGEIAKKSGCSENELIISCSHTHFAPGVEECYVTFPNGELELGVYPGDEKYFKLLVKQVSKAIKSALENLEPVTVEEAEIMLPELLFNRRTVRKSDGMVDTNYVFPKNDADYDFQYADPSLMVWRFRTKKGLKAIVARYGAHPVTGGSDFYKISADYPGYFQKYVQEYFGCPGFFMLGTNGDTVPIRRNGSSRSDIGNIMALSIRLAELRFREAPDFHVGITKVPLKLKLRVTTDRNTVDETFGKMLAEAKKKGKCDDEFRFFGYKRRFTKMYPSDDVTLEMNIARLGSRILVFLPFEVLNEVGTRLKKECPAAEIVSISNGYDGYLPLAKEYKRGGYEATWGPRFHKTAGDEILRLAAKVVKDLD